MKELVWEYIILVCEIDVDIIGSSSRVENEEFRSFGMKEVLFGLVLLVVEVVVGIGG